MATTAKKPKQIKKNAEITGVCEAFKALSNETRLAVFESIRLGCCGAAPDRAGYPTICDVASNFSSSLSTISHHIKELRNAGLIRCERRGQKIL